jgi:hypothetical protein
MGNTSFLNRGAGVTRQTTIATLQEYSSSSIVYKKDLAAFLKSELHIAAFACRGSNSCELPS